MPTYFPFYLSYYMQSRPLRVIESHTHYRNLTPKVENIPPQAFDGMRLSKQY
jgi:hypothetical protein